MAQVDSRTGIEIIDRRECLELLAAEDFGRVGILDGGAPLILPVNYALDGEDVVFRTGEGTKLDAVRRTLACFEIDGHDSDAHTGWSVVVRGRLEEVTTAEGEAFDRLAELAHPWASGQHDHVVRLVSESVRGRRVRKVPAG